jgi:hypothetical protein
MSDDAIAKYQKDDITGHRPTWKMGSIGSVGGRRRDGRRVPLLVRHQSAISPR